AFWSHRFLLIMAMLFAGFGWIAPHESLDHGSNARRCACDFDDRGYHAFADEGGGTLDGLESVVGFLEGGDDVIADHEGDEGDKSGHHDEEYRAHAHKEAGVDNRHVTQVDEPRSTAGRGEDQDYGHHQHGQYQHSRK